MIYLDGPLVIAFGNNGPVGTPRNAANVVLMHCLAAHVTIVDALANHRGLGGSGLTSHLAYYATGGKHIVLSGRVQQFHVALIDATINYEFICSAVYQAHYAAETVAAMVVAGHLAVVHAFSQHYLGRIGILSADNAPGCHIFI